MRLFLISLSALAATGCFATSGNVTKIKTTPPGALVTIEGLGECETPCTVELKKTRRVTIAKTGYNPLQFDVEPGGEDIVAELELAAPTEDVDSEALPDIQ